MTTIRDTLKLYHVMTTDRLLTARVADFCSVVVSTPDPHTRDLQFECETCRSKSGFDGFPRFIFSRVMPIKLIQNRPQPLLSSVLLSHFS
jgi:hypothetical protein